MAQIFLAAEVLHPPYQAGLHPLRCRSLHARGRRPGMLLDALPKPLAHFAVQGDESRPHIAPCAALCHQSEGRLAGLALDAKQLILVDGVALGLQPVRRRSAPTDAVRSLRNHALRAGDLVRLSWSHVTDDAIVITTGKSRHRREAVIPLYAELREVLARIPRRSPVILTSSKKRPWAKDGLSSSFAEAKDVA